MSEQVTRGDISDIISQFAAQDPAYRKMLLENPKEVLAKQMGQELPDGITVKVVEESADTIYLVAPYVAPAAGDELSDDDLEKVAGGKGKGGDGAGAAGESGDNTYTCNDAAGIGTRVTINTQASVF